MADSGHVCGMHICGKCAPMVLVFGLLFLLTGVGVLNLGAWWNWETLIGAFFVLWGLMGFMGK